MAIILGNKNQDNYFKSITGQKIITNDLNIIDAKSRDDIKRLMMDVYDSKTIDTVPKCDCGRKYGAYLLKANVICDFCNSPVTRVTDNKHPLIWFRRLEDMPKFLSPMYWLRASEILANKFDCLRWLSDSRYNPKEAMPIFFSAFIREYPEVTTSRTYLNLINNFERLLNYAKNHASYKTKNKDEEIEILLNEFRNDENIWSNYLGVPNKSLYVMQDTTKGKFINLGVSDIMDVVLSYIQMCGRSNLSDKLKSSVIARTISGLAKIANDSIKTKLASKPGIFRKHLYGSRANFTLRAVITSIAGKHQYDECHLPWSASVSLFRPHLINLLTNRHNMSWEEANLFIANNTLRYNKLLDDCFCTLIKESPNGRGMPITLQRNPSLLIGSIQNVRVTRIKTDIYDTSISLSILICPAQNADFDGDEENVQLLIDNKMAEMAKGYDNCYSLPSLNKVYNISGLLSMPKPAVNIISNYAALDKSEDLDLKYITDKLGLVDI